MNKQSAGVLGLTIVLGGLTIAVSCSSDPSPTEPGSGGDGSSGSSSGGAGGSPDGSAGAMGGVAGGMGGMAESGQGGVNEGGGSGHGGEEQHAGAAGQSGSSSGAGGEAGDEGSDVVGTVVDGEGVVVAGTMVEIAGQIVVTDTLGRFTVHHVPETYSAVIVFAPPSSGAAPPPIRTVEIYDELTTRSPHFQLVHAPNGAHVSEISGSLSGGAGFPMPDDLEHKFAATSSSSNRALEDAQGILEPTKYSLPALIWAAEPANKYTVGGLQWRAGQNGLPTAYDGWASQQVVIPPTPNFVTVTSNLVLASVNARTVTGIITKPAGCVPSVQGSVGGISLFNNVPTTSTYSYLMPEPLSGATTRLTASCAWGSNANRTASLVSVGLDAANSLDLAIASPPSLIQPAHEATGVTYATPLSWAAGDYSLRAIRFQVGGWVIYRYGTGTTSSFPDLTRFGVSIPPGSTGSWVVWSFEFDGGASATWDDNTGRLWDLASTGHSIAKAESQEWQFTLAP